MLTKVKFSDAFIEFNSFSSKRRKKQGYQTMIRNFNNHILPYFKDMYLCDLSVKDIINWQDTLYEKKFGNSFYNSLYYNLSSFFNFCVDFEYMNSNIIKKVKKFKKKYEKKEYNVYTKKEFKKFIKNLDNFIDKEFFSFMYYYGTRSGETYALRFSDIDFNNKIVHIRHNLQRRGNRELDTPKNFSSIRDISIDFITCRHLMKLKKMYISKYNDNNYDYFLFGGKRPLSTTTMDRHKKIACEKAKIKIITQHEFRHSYATRMCLHEPIEFVSKSMGHSKPSTTYNIYCHNEKRHNKCTLFRRFF